MADESTSASTRSAAKEAAARQAVELLGACCMIVIGVALQLAQREASQPDFIPLLGKRLKSHRAGWAKRCERGWAVAAGWAWRRAERFRREHEELQK